MRTFLKQSPDEVSILAVDRTMASGVLVDESFRLGEYAIRNVSRGVVINGGGKYEFITGGDSAAVEATCSVQRSQQSILRATYSLDCVCGPRDDAPSTRLRAESDADGNFHGSVELGGAAYPLRSLGSYTEVGTQVNPVFSVGDPRIMAVDVGTSGEVWLGPAAQAERQSAACLAAGLMLFRPQHADPPR